MLDGNDKGTFYALRLLREVVDKRQKPLVIWVGAGVSRWCDFPSWQETAEIVHRNYRRFGAEYDRVTGERLIQEIKFPELFELFRQTNPQRYNRELVTLFGSRVPTPVYSRFLGILRAIAPLQIVTTNIDETLEHNIPSADTVQRSDIERCVNLLGTETSFVAKLHGSIGTVGSTVFTTSDYRELMNDPQYLRTLEALFARSIVVFIGYGLRDKYVLDMFEANCKARPLFGDGPHFLVQGGGSRLLPESIKTIRYLPEPHADHRSAMIVLDIVRVVRDGGHVWFAPQNASPRLENRLASAYFISDVTPPGTWTSSQSLVLGSRNGLTPNAIVGQGFDDSELPDKVSPALHDLTVGLISFDHLYFPLSRAASLHGLIGSEMFWILVKLGVFSFVNFEFEPIMIFRNVDAVDGGDIGWMHVSAESGGPPPTIEQQIRGQFRIVPGHETTVEPLFEIMMRSSSNFDHARFNIPSLTRGALLHPSVRRLLGISDAILPTSMPRWVKFPILRLAHTIMVGCACDDLSLSAAKIGFGSEILVGAAFAVSAARDWADDVSSYVLTGQLGVNLTPYVQANPETFKKILAFRDSQPGIDLRREILEELATSAGSEFVASVNAGLNRLVPSVVMENARQELSGLLFRKKSDSGVVPAVWTNIRNSDSIARSWRKKCREELQAYCNSRGIRPKSACPCGSGEKLRDCCALALEH